MVRLPELAFIDELEEASIVNDPLFISTLDVVVISTSLALPWILTPLAPSSDNAPADVDQVAAAADVRVNAPALVVRFEAAPASRLNPAPESIVMAPSASISRLATLEASLLLADIVIVFVVAAFAVIVRLVVSVLSIESVVPSTVIPAVESISKLPTFISNTPVVVTSISLAFPCILTPSAPSSVSAPPDVVRLEASAASIEIPEEP